MTDPPLPRAEDETRTRQSVYIAIVVVEALVILALYAFGAYFS